MAAQIQLLIDLANAQAAASTAAAANVAAIAAAAGPLPPNIAQPVAPIPYAFLPGMAITTLLDYSVAGKGGKIYSATTEALKTPFDLTSENLQVFLEKVSERASVYNWTDILNIPDGAGVQQNLITNFGLLSLEQCRDHAATYINTATRDAQNTGMLFMFLKASITDEARMMVMSHVDEYTVQGKPSGTCLLKVLIGKSTVDTIATVYILRKSIANLGSKMHEFNSNIKLFNQYVGQIRQSLFAHGESTPELMMNLFEGYAQTGDADFVRYIQSIRDTNDDGRHPVTVETLMMLAINKYEVSMTHGTWTLTETKDAQIIALKAELEKKKKGKGNQNDDNRFAWKLIPPAEGDKTSKMWNKKKYHWCPKHDAWTVHTPEACNLPAKSEVATTTTTPTPPSPAASTIEKQGLYLNKAYQAIQEEEDGIDM